MGTSDRNLMAILSVASLKAFALLTVALALASQLDVQGLAGAEVSDGHVSWHGKGKGKDQNHGKGREKTKIIMPERTIRIPVANGKAPVEHNCPSVVCEEKSFYEAKNVFDGGS